MQDRPSTGAVVWLTGFSGAGKTTLANCVCHELRTRNLRAEVLDGDNMRQHICRGLGFSREDRDENVRRIGFVANLLARNGVVVLVSAVSPYREIRDEVRRASSETFIEVHVSTPVEICEQRDPKGLYRRARAGELRQFTGIDDPYEPPLEPDVVCPTHEQSTEVCVARILSTVLSATAVTR